MKLTSRIAIVLVALAAVARAEIKTQTVEYKDGDTTLKGFVAYDDAQDAVRPGIIVVHEWWGLNDYIKSRCVQLAKLGYVAFAPDIYGDGFVTSDPKQAEQRMTDAKKNGWLRSR